MQSNLCNSVVTLCPDFLSGGQEFDRLSNLIWEAAAFVLQCVLVILFEYDAVQV